jgi:hypothetical protein
MYARPFFPSDATYSKTVTVLAVDGNTGSDKVSEGLRLCRTLNLLQLATFCIFLLRVAFKIGFFFFPATQQGFS